MLLNVLVFSSIITASIALSLAIQAMRLRKVNGRVFFIGLMAAVIVWTSARAFEALAYGMQMKILWAKVEYLGIASVPTLWLLYSFAYLFPGRSISRRNVALLAIIPVLILGVVVTNERHSLFWTRVEFAPQTGGVTLVYTHGLLFWLAAAYNYALMSYSTIAICLAARGNGAGHPLTLEYGTISRRQAGFLGSAAVFPWLGNAIYLLGLSPLPGLDLTPFGFALGGLVVLFKTYNEGLLDLIPVARDVLIESLHSAVLVLDERGRVVDMNTAARRLAGLSENTRLGQPVESLLVPWYTRIVPFLAQAEAREEICIIDDPPTYVELQTTPISDRQGGFFGKLVVLRDITERKHAEQQLTEALELNRKMISASLLGILVYGDTGQCLLANGAAARIVGGSIDDLLGQNFRRISSWKTCGLLEAAEKAISNGQPVTGEFHFVTTFGFEVWLDCYFTPFSSGGSSHLLLIFNDTTERVKARLAEHEQRVLAEALRDTSAAINQNLDLSGVQERILANIGRVVPHDSASIILLADQNYLQVVHAAGYSPSQVQVLRDALRRPLEGLPHLRKMAETGQPVIIPDTWQDPLWTLGSELPWVQAYAGAPISNSKGCIVGFIQLECTAPGCFHADQSERLQAFALDAAIALENARLHAEVQRLTMIDELTHVYNYRGLLELGEREFERASRFARPLSALFIDLDHFRQINNGFSHASGNEILCEVAQRFQSSVRAVDLVSRYGGEEFVILLPEIAENQAACIAERLRVTVEQICLPAKGGELHVTASIGVAGLRPGMATLGDLLDAANQAEHRAKASGRNCVISAEDCAIVV